VAAAPNETPEGEKPLAAQQLDRFAGLADKLLERTDLAAKALAGLGSAAITAIGIVRVTDVFPYEGPDAWLIAMIAGFLAMGAALGFFTRRLWGVQQPVVMLSDPAEMKELDSEEERALVAEVYDEIAKLNDVASLRAYEARFHRLDRAADRLGDPKRAAELRTQAAEIELEVRATMARARLNVLRRRAMRAIFGFRALVAYGLFLGGFLGFGMGADAIEAKRSGDTELEKSELEVKTSQIELAKACAEARTVKASEALLKAACGPPEAPGTDEAEAVAPEETVDASFEELAAQRTSCRAAARKAEKPLAACAGIDRAIAAALAEP